MKTFTLVAPLYNQCPLTIGNRPLLAHRPPLPTVHRVRPLPQSTGRSHSWPVQLSQHRPHPLLRRHLLRPRDPSYSHRIMGDRYPDLHAHVLPRTDHRTAHDHAQSRPLDHGRFRCVVGGSLRGVLRRVVKMCGVEMCLRRVFVRGCMYS